MEPLVELIVRRIGGEPIETLQIIDEGVTMIERASVGPVPQRHRLGE